MIRFIDIDPSTPFRPEPIKTAEFECFHCRDKTVISVRTIESKESEYWREKYQTLMGSLNQALSDCNMLHGDDPMRIFFVNRLIEIREKISRIDEKKPPDSAK
jgi:hypothetical protein